VEYVIEYTSKGEIVKATLNTELLNTTIDTQLQQKHVIIFQVTLSLYNCGHKFAYILQNL